MKKYILFFVIVIIIGAAYYFYFYDPNKYSSYKNSIISFDYVEGLIPTEQVSDGHVELNQGGYRPYPVMTIGVWPISDVDFVDSIDYFRRKIENYPTESIITNSKLITISGRQASLFEYNQGEVKKTEIFLIASGTPNKLISNNSKDQARLPILIDINKFGSIGTGNDRFFLKRFISSFKEDIYPNITSILEANNDRYLP